jgi:hypothetical protein
MTPLSASLAVGLNYYNNSSGAYLPMAAMFNALP